MSETVIDTDLCESVFAHFENHPARDYVTEDVVLANMPDNIGELDIDELVDRIADNIHAAWVDPADVVSDLEIGWDADVFELDGEDDDWEGFLFAVADEVVMSALTHDGREGEAIYDPVDASQYRGALG